LDSSLPAALVEAAASDDPHPKRIATEARALVAAGASVEETLRQLFLLGAEVAQVLPDDQGVRLVRGLGYAAEAVAASYVSSAEELAQTDELTGLPNRRVLARDLDGAVTRVDASGGAVALAILDLDGLKVANDEFGGHLAGDHYIKRFGAQLLDAVRSQGRVYHWHGDEFCVLLRDLSRGHAESLLAQIRSRPNIAPFSYGVAACPEDGLDAEGLQVTADEERLYAMKESRTPRERAASARAWLGSAHWDYADPGYDSARRG
jgi:diguanylate cyclase (GGDEF)-like protein